MVRGGARGAQHNSQRAPAGVPLRTGEAASRECRCSETRAVLNCLDTQLE